MGKNYFLKILTDTLFFILVNKRYVKFEAKYSAGADACMGLCWEEGKVPLAFANKCLFGYDACFFFVAMLGESSLSMSTVSGWVGFYPESRRLSTVEGGWVFVSIGVDVLYGQSLWRFPQSPEFVDGSRILLCTFT